MKNRMNKGFTLVELIVIIIVLGIVALIAIPVVTNTVKEARQKAYDSLINSIELAAYNYGVINSLGHNIEKQELQFEELIAKGVIKSSELINPITNEPLKGCITYYWNETKERYIYEYDSSCNRYIDTSGANKPELLENMIPIVYDGTNWIYADLYNKWYDYKEQEWANAVVLNSGVTKSIGDTISEEDIALWYVWIPRYKYVIFNGNNGSVPEQVIDVKFEKDTASTGTVSCVDAINQTDSSGNSISEICTDEKNGSVVDGTSTYTHPAFTFGDKELTGIWVGKFDNSTTDEECNNNASIDTCNKVATITIKPNVVSWRHVNLANSFNSILNIKTTYNITNADSHMMKHMEWGAVTYLKQSIYGIGKTRLGMNNNSLFITGCGAKAGSSASTECSPYDTTTGVLASTTGNVYGIYDMSGGAWTSVMAGMVMQSGVMYNFSSYTGFTSLPDSKYYDIYSYNADKYAHSRGKLGDATKETMLAYGKETGTWTYNYAYFITSAYAQTWFMRGGHYSFYAGASIFRFNPTEGRTGFASRSILVAEEY